MTTQIGRNCGLSGGHCAGIHLNMPIGRPTPEAMKNPTAEERTALAALAEHRTWGTGYSKQQSTRPQTLGYGLVDSPVGQMAWIVEKFWAWMDCDGNPENVLSRDELLDNVMVYWVTGTGASSARLYWESFRVWGQIKRVELPTGIASFPGEILRAPRRGASRSTTSRTGRRCRAVAISPRSSSPNCSSTTSVRSSRRCAKPAQPSVNPATRHADWASRVSDWAPSDDAPAQARAR